MELVKGVPITQYCDDDAADAAERLELFVPVCQAVQHAHQKGIIHRDLKPSNILVALYDGKPVPKVIDFGVAKATGQQLTEQTLFTEFGSMVGTLEYMAPEQAELNNLDIDTRADVYSLGVLLYELLTGSAAVHAQASCERRRFDEMLRIIREVEPPKPSTRLLDRRRTAERSPPAGRLEPKQLTELGPRRTRLDRDEGAGEGPRPALRDGQRLGAGRRSATWPTSRCWPVRRSAAYRLRKFVRRNRGPVTAASLCGVLARAVLAARPGKPYGPVEARDAAEQATVLARGNYRLALDAFGDMVHKLSNTS